jgi:hypothetical protein
MYRKALPQMIREHGSLTEEEQAQLGATGVTYDPISDTVEWAPPAGQARDLEAERNALVRAADIFLEPGEPIMEEQLADALTNGVTFEQLAAELGLTIPEWMREAKQ